MTDQNAALANALEKCDWSNTPIGNKVLIKNAIDALRATTPISETISDEMVARGARAIFESRNKTPMNFSIDSELARACLMAALQ